MGQTVLVLGAGADKTPGINFPLAADLLPEISGYLKNSEDGQKVEKILRDNISGLSFRFDKFINSAITDIAHREPDQLRHTIERVQRAIDNIPAGEENDMTRKQGKLIVLLFNRLQTIAENNEIDEETRQLIREVFGERADEFDLDDHVVDIRTLSISDTVKTILRHALRQSLESGANEVARALGSDMLDIEGLLIEKFLGFYNNRLSDIKSYVYISWCFWAYLVHRNKQITQAAGTVPFYSTIPDSWRGITLNYTSFLEDRLGADKVCYFHGGLRQYVRMDNRELLRFDTFDTATPAEMLESQICGAWNFDKDNPSKSVCLIPSLVPPLRLKPILSKEYIRIWHDAATWLDAAGKIIIVGYSLNTADEHFNDLIRANRGKSVCIIGPDVLHADFLERVARIMGTNPAQLTQTQIQGHRAKKDHSLLLVAAKAHDINLEQLAQ